MERNRNHIRALTSIRFFAAFAVVLFHTMPITWDTTNPIVACVYALKSLGPLGVSLFFVLSGFILYYVYRPRLCEKTFSTSDFLLARFARIYPVYTIGLIIAAPVFFLNYLWPYGLADPRSHALITAPLLLQAWYPQTSCEWNCPGWSLSAEATFYLLFPIVGAIMVRLRSRTIMRWCVLSYIVIVLPMLLFAWFGMPMGVPRETSVAIRTLWYQPLLRFPEFLIGMATCAFLLRGRYEPMRARWPTLALFGIMIPSAFLSEDIRLVFFRTGVFAPIFAWLIYCLAARRGGRTLRHPRLVLLGSASYSLFIIHEPITTYYRHLGSILPIDPSNPVLYVAYLVGLVMLSIAVYRWFETPARETIRNMAGRWWQRRRSARQAVAG